MADQVNHLNTFSEFEMAAEDDEITPEERAEYEATFNLMDKDKNGEVTCFGWFLAEIFLFLKLFFSFVCFGC